jgi:hypothetical protein
LPLQDRREELLQNLLSQDDDIADPPAVGTHVDLRKVLRALQKVEVSGCLATRWMQVTIALGVGRAGQREFPPLFARLVTHLPHDLGHLRFRQWVSSASSTPRLRHL